MRSDFGGHITLLFAEPAHELTPELRELYDENRCAVVPQLGHSESNPGDAVDLALLVNGIPVATAELKTQTTGQDVRDAVAQYRHDRNVKDLIFAARAVVFSPANSVVISTVSGSTAKGRRATPPTRRVTRRPTSGSRSGSAGRGWSCWRRSRTSRSGRSRTP